MTQEQATQVFELFKEYEDETVSVSNWLSSEEMINLNSFTEIYEALQGKDAFTYEGEVIYYNNAMEYLTTNDASLTNSIELARDLGYELKDINSELLATLLKTQEVEQFFRSLEDEVSDILNA